MVCGLRRAQALKQQLLKGGQKVSMETRREGGGRLAFVTDMCIAGVGGGGTRHYQKRGTFHSSE